MRHGTRTSHYESAGERSVFSRRHRRPAAASVTRYRRRVQLSQIVTAQFRLVSLCHDGFSRASRVIARAEVNCCVERKRGSDDLM
jgi:hypothetical protein